MIATILNYDNAGLLAGIFMLVFLAWVFLTRER